MSNYGRLETDEEVRVNADWDEDPSEDDEPEEVRCPAHCRNGIVEVHGQETDCITCEGYGTIYI